MKTKHLLFAAALPLAFAACTNEEFDSQNNSPELSSEQRPLVEVKLDFQKGDADTRVSYNGTGYGWEATDKIGAFLMDEIISDNKPFGATADKWAKESWLEHYGLVNYIHTDYPFSWNASTSAWEAPSKLQEGNYFFAAPYETYEGQRQLIHKIDGQTQAGGTEADMNKAIAKNQYFIGYAQVKAGAENKEALKSVIMTPALAPIKVTLRNIGTKAKDVEKIIVRGDYVATALTVDPTNAPYGGTDADGSIKKGKAYNLGESGGTGNTAIFNYANLIDATEDLAEHSVSTSFVYNIASGAEDYKKGDALRQIVQASYSVAVDDEESDEETEEKEIPAIEKQAILTFESPVKVESKEEIHFAVMVNAIPKVGEGELHMDIITTQGQITGIDLTKIKEAEAGSTTLGDNTVLTNNAITSLKPSVQNELIIQFDNNSVVKAQNIDVDDEAKLLAFINWNGENQRTNTATLLKDVHFTKAMYNALKAAGYKGSLAIKASETTEAKLLVDNDVPTDVLNLLDKTTSVNIVMNGERELTKAIADKLNADQSTSLTIENRGEMTVKEEVVAYAKLENYGTIKVTETGKLKGQAGGGKVCNYGVIENKGEISNVNNSVDPDDENAKGLIKTSSKRNHIQVNEEGATVQLTNIGDPVQIVGENEDGKYGTIYFETAAGVKVSKLAEVKDKRSVGVTKLNVTGGTIDFDAKDNSTVKELTINGTVTLEGWDDSTPERKRFYHCFNEVEKAEISGNVTFNNAGIESGKILVNKDASLVFENTAKLLNEVTFVKGATARVNESGVVEVESVVWNNNNISNFGEFTYVNTDGVYNVVEGNNIEQKREDALKKTVEFSVKISESGNASIKAPIDGQVFVVNSLKALDEFMKGEGDVSWGENVEKYNIKDITISSQIKLSDEADGTYGDNHYSFLKTYAAGKEVILDNEGNLTGLKTTMELSFGKLTFKGSQYVMSGDEKQPNVTILTVSSLDYSGADIIGIKNGYIQIVGNAQIGDGSSAIAGVKDKLRVDEEGSDACNGNVVTVNKNTTGGTDALIKWNPNTNKWVALDAVINETNSGGIVGINPVD